MPISISTTTITLLPLLLPTTLSFLTPTSLTSSFLSSPQTTTSSSLSVSIGTGPSSTPKYDNYTRFRDGKEYYFAWNCEYRPREDVEEPDHELYRKSRMSEMDKKCDDWFGTLVGGEKKGDMVLGGVGEALWERLHTPVKLEYDPERHWFVGFEEEENWSPYRHYRLPGEKIYPAFGLETYGLPVVRQLAETWRHFDVPGLVDQDYSLSPDDVSQPLELTDEETQDYITKLVGKGAWLDDSSCSGRLVYINGRYCPSLSLATSSTRHLSSSDFASENSLRPDILEALSHLPEGFTDELPTESEQEKLGDIAGSDTFSGLSAPDHNMRSATSQYCINHQQGMAAFCALNAVRTGGVALVDAPEELDVVEKMKAIEDNEKSVLGKPEDVMRDDIVKGVEDVHDAREMPKPILIVNAVENDGGCSSKDEGRGVAVHPRTLVMAGKGSLVNLVQQCVDLDKEGETEEKPVFYNGVTQIFARSGSMVKHCYVDETGGLVTPNVEEGGDAATAESLRTPLKSTHFETIDTQLTGRYAAYRGTHIATGGSGRIKLAVSTSLLQKYTSTHLNGMMIAGGAQNTDMRGYVHHIAPLGVSEHQQRNIVSGCADTTWKGRIRMDKDCFDSEGDQLAKTLLLTDSAHILAMPCLDIICDKVKCAHGATVADLNDDELLYLQSRGLNPDMARNLLMEGFVDEIGKTLDRGLFGRRTKGGLRGRIVRQIKNLVPRGVKDEESKEYSSM